MLKSIAQSPFFLKVLGAIVAAYMTLVKYTTRWSIEHSARVEPIIKGGKGVIALTWHSRFLMLTSAWKKSYQTPHVLISRSRDGNVVAHASHFLGLKTIRGSSQNASKNKGGAKAGQDIVEAIENDGCIVITPDGPRGPYQRVVEGPIRLARLTGAPLMPCAFAIKNRKQLSTWDKLIVPLPFGRGKIIWGTPVYIPAEASDADIERYRSAIEHEMNELLAKADSAMGHEPTWPTPLKDKPAIKGET